MFLHGCNQTAAQAVVATRFNALADTEKLTVVYPEQVQSAPSSAPLADGASGSLTHDAMGDRARVVPLFVENGTADVLNPAVQSQNLVDSWLGAGWRTRSRTRRRGSRTPIRWVRT